MATRLTVYQRVQQVEAAADTPLLFDIHNVTNSNPILTMNTRLSDLNARNAQ